MMDFPKTADVVIIGGGVVGTATAYYLAKSGRKNVVLIEKNTVCSGSTGRCGAGIRAQWGLELNCRMALACLDTFEQLDEELGLPTGLNQGGYLLVAYKDKEWAQFKKNVELQHSLGSPSIRGTDMPTPSLPHSPSRKRRSATEQNFTSSLKSRDSRSKLAGSKRSRRLAARSNADRSSTARAHGHRISPRWRASSSPTGQSVTRSSSPNP